MRIRFRLGLLNMTICCKINIVCCTYAAYKNTLESNTENSGDKKREKERGRLICFTVTARKVEKKLKSYKLDFISAKIV